MKRFLFLIFTLSLLSYGKQIYTNQRYFDCKKSSGFIPETDKKQLIYAILDRAVVSKKDIVDYRLIEDKNKIYINDIWYSQFYGGMSKPKTNPINPSDIPNQIGNITFCLKSETELQAIADKTNDFMYLTLGNIEIDGESAKIGLANGWIMSKKNKGKYVMMSGGGYVWEFKKTNGIWKFYKIITDFQS